MSAPFYHTVRTIGRVVFSLASAPRVLHAQRVPQRGAYLLAANHICAYDAPLLILAHPRMIHWLSIVELFRHPLSRWFLQAFGALPLDRRKVDTRTVRRLIRLLKAGRVVGIFPEGGVRPTANSVLESGAIESGVCQLAQLAAVPVLPCVVLGAEKFRSWTNWLPGARTRWAVAFGEVIPARMAPDRATARAAMADEITLALRALRAEVAAYV